ncbi:hypothetical protein LshimejAT787_1401000 [Lyophyllum shimeji]|uniref:F-box domain-containing protein n=1 Tax=Lyophyllum shimeji TaxID=47721 RepID=A0A9P3PX47_LYOSH|nr:hypothetical protein LshimejAT787_1401000 [Lyophyllum shimeji]
MEAESSTMGALRQTRAYKKRKSDATIADPEDDNDDSKEIVRKSAKKRRIAGRLAGLMDLPIDILFEIFGHLKPFDLLRLSRMTKEFRRLLMHKSSVSVWKAALERIPGLPPCPPGISEPAWVNLAFDPHCHFCFTTGVRPVEWALRVRICTKCAKDQITEVYMPDVVIDERVDTDNYPFESLLPYRLGKRGRRGVLITELQKVKQQYKALKGKDARLAFIRERRMLKSEIQKHALLCSAWARNQNFDRSHELQQLKDERRHAVIARLNALGYAEDIAGIRYPDALEDHALVKKPQKLTDRIWANIKGPIIDFMEEMRTKRLAREHAQLVLERKPSAVAAFRDYKNSRLPVTDVMPQGLDVCDFPPVKAILEQPSDVTIDKDSFADIIPLLPELIAEWRVSLDDQLTGVIKFEDRLARIRRNEMLIASMFAPSWAEYDDYDDVYDDVPSPQSPLAEMTLSDRLKLATTVFSCKACTHNDGYDDGDSSESLYEYGLGSDGGYFSFHPVRVYPLFYPKVRGHRCLTRCKQPPWSWGPVPEPARKLDNTQKLRRKWTARPLKIDRRLSACVEALVTEAGLDPLSATADDMDALDVWFACVHCAFPLNSGKKNKIPFETFAFKWRDAVEHQGIRHLRTDNQWKKLTAEGIELARQEYETNTLSSRHNDALSKFTDEPAAEDNADKPDKSWLCVHCRDTPAEIDPSEFDVVKTHLAEKHDIQDPEENRDYYKDYAAVAPSPPRCKVLIKLDKPKTY